MAENREPDFDRAEFLMDGRVRYMPPVATAFRPKLPRAVVTITVDYQDAEWFASHLPNGDDMTAGWRAIADALAEVTDDS